MDVTTKNNNLEKYKTGLVDLIEFAYFLQDSMFVLCYPDKKLKKLFCDSGRLEPENLASYINSLPSFHLDYQGWYSKSLSIIKFLLPDRLDDFIRQYKTPNNRSIIDYSSYVIEDFLNGIRQEGVVVMEAAIPKFIQQRAILKVCYERFNSSLFDIKRLLQADLFNSELEAAKELINKGFYRAAGAIAGVVLESHFAQICESNNLKLSKKDPSINDYNEFLKKEEVITLNEYKHISLLASIRNQCVHNKSEEPAKNDVETLIDGVSRVMHFFKPALSAEPDS
ncbi:MAG: hypothetical protein K2X04_00970 [Burkholderiales bacterium]|nr:hypothetical protein [Burkholderiales bacterium]